MNHISVRCLFHIAYKWLRWASPLLGQMAVELSGTVHNGVSQTRGISRELRQLPGAHSLCGSGWQDLGRARSNSDQAPSPHKRIPQGALPVRAWHGSWCRACGKGTEALQAQPGSSGIHLAESYSLSKLCTQHDWCTVLWGEHTDTQESAAECALRKGGVNTRVGGASR